MQFEAGSQSFDEGAGPAGDRPAGYDLERRTDGRRTYYYPSFILIEPGGRSFDCTIRNVSARGARIVLSEDVDLPNSIQILIRPGKYFSALVRWRIGLEIGLEFVG
jgi:hypothetical protein